MAGDDIGDLVRRAQAGDQPAVERLLEIVRPHLLQLADRFTDRQHPSRSGADLVQEAWLQAWQKLDQFQGRAGECEQSLAMFRVWVSRILIRLGLNRARNRRALRHNPAENILRLDPPCLSGSGGSERGIDPSAGSSSPSANARRNEQAVLIQDAMARCLEPEEREMIRLTFFEGLSLRQSAERTGLSYDQARARYRTAMRKLERQLEPER
jgi:RNA polymerase sigma factor (sigma-70 family)